MTAPAAAVRADRFARLWMRGELHSSPTDPVGAVVTHLTEEFDAADVTFRPWKPARGAADRSMATTASWRDPDAGLVVAALVVGERAGPDEPDRVEWGCSAYADHGWSGAADSPAATLALAGAGVRDPSGVPVFAGPVIAADAPNWTELETSEIGASEMPGSPPLGRLIVMATADDHERLTRALADPARTTGVLITAAPGPAGPTPDELAATVWPGLCTVVVASARARKSLARRLPQRPVPVGGARWFAPATRAGDAARDVVFSKAALRRPGWSEPLFANCATACVRHAPTGPAAEAAALLDEHPLLRRLTAPGDAAVPARPPALPVPRLPEPDPPKPAPPKPPAVPEPSGQAEPAGAKAELARLREAHQRLCEQHRQLRDKHQRTCTQVASLDEQLQQTRPQLNLLADLTAENDTLLAENQRLSAERDTAVRERGILAHRLAALTRAGQAGPDAAVVTDTVPGSMRELLAQAADQYPLLDFTRLDPDPSDRLDHHPKADGWRRKLADAFTSLHHYATAKRRCLDNGRPPGPDLATFYAFLTSGHPGALISAHIIAMSESDMSERNHRYRQARTFPVDPSTDPSGRAFMGAHIKLDTLAPAPRVHFLDVLADRAKIHIGYVGEHLPSARTN
ncbi:hypothetical protein [Actinomadura litoris]|uniref:Uncharacterized protein n=1 Tax=Actinomadura litoris TaxID=2678616 RepID=A0A7K1L5B6_9ACTN|nr:hypothetical protein [Actinomadura litoris]MUN39483.1 hypothetical protein [Actinomadura litoris]